MIQNETSPEMLSAMISSLQKAGNQIDHEKIEHVIQGLIAQRDALAAKVEELELENDRLLKVASIALKALFSAKEKNKS